MAMTATELPGSMPRHLVDVLGVEQPAVELPVDVDEGPIELRAQAAQLDRADRAVLVLGHEQDVDHTHEATLHEVPQRRGR